MFLDMVRMELSQKFDMGDIASLCNFNYSISNIKFKNYRSDKGSWRNAGGLGTGGLFGYDEDERDIYTSCVENFNNHLLDEFKSDWRKITPGVSTDAELNSRDYHYILLSEYATRRSIYDLRDDTISALYSQLNYPPSESATIDSIFKKGDDETWSNKVRFINAIKTTLPGQLVGMFVANDTCNLFIDNNNSIQWHTIDA